MIVSEALEKAGETVSRDREADRVVGMVDLAVFAGCRTVICCDRDYEDEFIKFFLLLPSSIKSSRGAARCLCAQKFERSKASDGQGGMTRFVDIVRPAIHLLPRHTDRSSREYLIVLTAINDRG